MLIRWLGWLWISCSRIFSGSSSVRNRAIRWWKLYLEDYARDSNFKAQINNEGEWIIKLYMQNIPYFAIHTINLHITKKNLYSRFFNTVQHIKISHWGFRRRKKLTWQCARAKQYIKIHKKAFTISINKHNIFWYETCNKFLGLHNAHTTQKYSLRMIPYGHKLWWRL